MRDKKKYKGQTQRLIDKDYKYWKPVTLNNISFFVKIGRHSKSPKEAEIAKLLTQLGIEYYREVSFDLKKRFDFYVPCIKSVIEYDGMQHFGLHQIKNDIYKESILKNKSIKLIRYNRNTDLQKDINLLFTHINIKKCQNYLQESR